MKNKGISLIVLIITIVVIIILATAIIVNIAQTNLIENATEAVVKQDFKTLQEELNLYIADKYAEERGNFKAENLDVADKGEIAQIITSIKGTKYEDYIIIEDGKIIISDTMPEPEKTWAMEVLGLVETTTNVPTEPDVTDTPIVSVNTTVQNQNSTITGSDFAYNNPVIPVGFKAVNTEKASWNDENNDGIVDGWNNGLVLVDSDNNEYVWIPVDGTSVKYEKWNGSVNNDNTVKSEQTSDDTLPTGISSETEQITKYGGFYVARYEAGLPDEQTTDELMLTKIFSVDDNNRSDIGKAQSKTNKIVWNRIDYNNAKTVSESVISTNYVKTGLLTGKQWDTMLTFLSQEVNVDTDCIAWGNYYDKYNYSVSGYYITQYKDAIYSNGEYTKTGEGYLLLPTGKFGNVVTEGSPKNIFDIGGNVWEWTAETVIEQGGSNTSVGNKVFRGGSCYNYAKDRVASYRDGYNNATGNSHHVGFRFALFIK